MSNKYMRLNVGRLTVKIFNTQFFSGYGLRGQSLNYCTLEHLINIMGDRDTVEQLDFLTMRKELEVFISRFFDFFEFLHSFAIQL